MLDVFRRALRCENTRFEISHQSPSSAAFRSGFRGFSCLMQGGGVMETFERVRLFLYWARGCAVAAALLCCVSLPTHRCNSLKELSAQPTHAQSRPSIDSCMPTHFITSLVSMATSNITDHYPCVGVDYSVGASRG